MGRCYVCARGQIQSRTSAWPSRKPEALDPVIPIRAAQGVAILTSPLYYKLSWLRARTPGFGPCEGIQPSCAAAYPSQCTSQIFALAPLVPRLRAWRRRGAGCAGRWRGGIIANDEIQWQICTPSLQMVGLFTHLPPSTHVLALGPRHPPPPPRLLDLSIEPADPTMRRRALPPGRFRSGWPR